MDSLKNTGNRVMLSGGRGTVRLAAGAGVGGLCQGWVGSSPDHQLQLLGHPHPRADVADGARAGHLATGKSSHRQRLGRANNRLLRYSSASLRIPPECEAKPYLRPLMTRSRICIDLFHVGASGPDVC